MAIPGMSIKMKVLLLLSPVIGILLARALTALEASDLPELLGIRDNVVIKPTFVFSGAQVVQLIKTQSPANYNEVKAQALFDLFVPNDDNEDDEDCCKEAEIWCRLRAQAPKFVPAFAAPFLLRSKAEPKDEDTTIEGPMAKRVVAVLEHALLTKTTPAYLPAHGFIDKDTAMAFYQLMHGAFRNTEPDKDEAEIVHDIEQETERCTETDTLMGILTTIFIDLPAANKIAKSPITDWLPDLTSSANVDMQGLFDVAFARFRKMPSIKFQYHLKGSLLYALEKEDFNFKKHCDRMWEIQPAHHPTSFLHRVVALFDKTPLVKERSCFDANPFTSVGMNPVTVATCNAYALDPKPVDYEKQLPRGRRNPGLLHTAIRKEKAPLIPPVCHHHEHIMFQFLATEYDYTDICTDLWAKHPHTHPKARRGKIVKTHDNTKEQFWSHEFTKKPMPLESFCLSFELGRNPKDYMGPFADTSLLQQPERPKDVPAFLQLLHSN